MTAARPIPSDATLSALLQGADEHDLHIWRPMQGDRPASVLVPLITGDGELRVLLTRRSPHLNTHAGEYSFPGGRPEPHDADALATALRETHEEVGVAADLVRVVGRLPRTTTYKTNYAITPFVGVIDAEPTWVAQVSEVAEVAEPRLADLIAGRQVHPIKRGDGVTVHMPVFPLANDHAVWGATARILDVLLARLAPIIDGVAPQGEPYEAVRALGPS
ncbi:MAG: CoA pyrophosphatase [Solirubrobacteraceae bacterium]|nr:CoA pyrophosphatase [Solirubrobacteraceae bacterium]